LIDSDAGKLCQDFDLRTPALQIRERRILTL